MVIERFKNGDPTPVRERFAQRGRMLPDGLEYVDSWIQTDGAVCYQLMRTNREELFNEWIANWCDLVDFEVIPVVTSQEFNRK